MRIPPFIRSRAKALLALGASSPDEAAYLARRRGIALRALRPAGAVRAHHAAALHVLEARVERAGDVVIYPPTVHWGRLQQRPHQILRELARRGLVAVFCTPPAGADGVDGLREVEPNLFLCSEPALLTGIERPVLWVNWTVAGAYVPLFRRPRVVYDYIDELDVLQLHCGRMVADHLALVRAADVVVATADRLLDAVRPIRADAVLAPNGVTPRDFQLLPGAPVPDDLANVLAADLPVVGYYGALARWLDFDLLNRVTATAPDLSFVIIGPDHDGSAARIARRPNVHLLGEKPYASLPAYSRRFDVALVPFAVSDVTRSTSPVKLFEYMAAGAPVVSTPVDECRKHRAVWIASGPDAFLAAIRCAIGRRDDPAYQALLALEVAENTWTARVDAILARLPRRDVPRKASGGGRSDTTRWPGRAKS